jgi:DNA replication protein DnaC
MSLDMKLLGRAKLRLEARKQENEAKQARRLEEVSIKCPRIVEIDRELRASVIDVIGVALRGAGNPVAAVDAIRDKNLDLQSERINELIGAGFPYDYLDNEYLCETCSDTGYAGTELCSCLRELYLEEQRLSLSNLFKLGNETFDNFNLLWYDDTPDPASGVSPRYKMEFVYDTCVDYATRFPKRSTNLFLSGGTGLGKTFLSACIARVVSDKGFSVVYDTAASIFGKFEEEKFSKTDDLSAVRDEIRRYLDCDLLIMDDLGTEMTTSFTVSALYALVNSRLTGGRKTIINSNLAAGDVYGRYSPQIASRIEGEYHVLNFCGRDIRLLKKGL